ncbi:MAG: hypothetical protein IPP90_10065 [Gemmatimonadaceae bacterium]|nr:hypothetical protein [Gemmatimonadaceae bacterium]
MKSTITGIVMQALMVVIGKYVPAVSAMPNFYAICGTLLATVTGAMVARSAPGAAAGTTATNGAIAGGVSSVVGGLAAVATGQWPDFQIVQILFPLISGAVGGGAGGMIGRMMSKGRSN